MNNSEIQSENYMVGKKTYLRFQYTEVDKQNPVNSIINSRKVTKSSS